MKVILFCIAAIAAGQSVPVNPTAATEAHNPNNYDHSAGGNHVTNAADTADWANNQVSSLGSSESMTDHDMHSDSITNPVQPQHGADTRSASDVATALGQHDRHPTLSAGNANTNCSSIICKHETRQYQGTTTSSIVVTHVCQDGTASDGTDATTGSWGARFDASNTNKNCTEETVCTSGHICGMTGNPATCECHAWDNLDTATHNYADSGNAAQNAAGNPVAAVHTNVHTASSMTNPMVDDQSSSSWTHPTI